MYEFHLSPELQKHYMIFGALYSGGVSVTRYDENGIPSQFVKICDIKKGDYIQSSDIEIKLQVLNILRLRIKDTCIYLYGFVCDKEYPMIIREEGKSIDVSFVPTVSTPYGAYTKEMTNAIRKNLSSRAKYVDITSSISKDGLLKYLFEKQTV